MSRTGFEKLRVYRLAEDVADLAWTVVIKWDRFARDTIGKQFVRATDSISANIAEGFGRYNKKDKIRFFRYSFGSLKEALDWNEKAKIRSLITQKQYEYIFSELSQLPREINYLIKFTNEKLTM